MMNSESVDCRDCLLRRAGLLAVVMGIAVGLFACGRPDIPKAKPLGPEAYQIDEGDRPQAGEFIRYKPADVRAGGLDIACIRYAPTSGKGPDVLFVGVVHVADETYYRTIQKVLDACPTVLYEAIKPPDVSVADWWNQSQAHGKGLQAQLAGWFGFIYQLAAIDYSHPRFVHCDMTAEEFQRAGGHDLVPGLERQGDVSQKVGGVLTRIRSLGDSVLTPDSPLSSIGRTMFAKTLGAQDLAETLDMFPGMADLILHKRNDIVIERLGERLERSSASDGPIAIFYGAAHGEGIEQGLRERYNYERIDATWYRAWATRPPIR